MPKNCLRLVALLSPLSLQGCDHVSYVHARMPLIRPLDAACLSTNVNRVTGHTATLVKHHQPNRDIVAYASYLTRIGNVSQAVTRDSSVYLEARIARISDISHEGFGRVEADSIGSSFGAVLRELRDACEGKTPRPGAFTIRVYAPLYEEWMVDGTNGRVSMRWIRESGEVTLQVDTLADGADARRPFWLEVRDVHIPAPPNAFGIGTECARGDSSPTGTIIAVTRITKTPFFGDVLQAWNLDVATLRIVPIGAEGVRCRNFGWGARWDTF